MEHCTKCVKNTGMEKIVGLFGLIQSLSNDNEFFNY